MNWVYTHIDILKAKYDVGYKIMPTGCWHWSGAKTGSHYGVICHKKRMVGAHRVGWILKNGRIPTGNIICHKCDNPVCVNPDHLFCGTFKDNSMDMTQKLRHKYGENSHQSKLKNLDVLAIRVLSKNGFSTRALSQIFKINRIGIGQIIRRKTWKHIPESAEKINRRHNVFTMGS